MVAGVGRRRRHPLAARLARMRRTLHLLGAVLAVAALAYFAVHASRNLVGHDLRQLLSPGAIAAGAALTMLYTVLTPITALAWAWLLRSLGQPARFTTTAPILAATQFGKYLPGNVAHHLGRVVVARAHGLGTGPVVLSMAYETLLVVVACAHVGALTLLWHPPAELAEWPLARHRGAIAIAVSVGALGLMAAAPAIARLLARLRSGGTGPAMMRTRPGWGATLACYLSYALNFVLVGFGLWLVAGTLASADATVANLVLLIGAFASSWILGFLAPGAPAGLGIREAVLSVWLGAAFGAATAVSLVIVLRIATTLGDLLNFLWGSFVLARRSRRERSVASDPEHAR